MAEAQEQLDGLVPEGTILGVAEAADGQAWLLTPLGLLRWAAGGWQPLPQGQLPLPLTSLTWAGDSLFVGTNSGQIVYSRDGGQSWYSGHLRQPVEAVTCLVASPDFERDGVLLAGTAGTGILRSTDGGRNWQLSNFGLHDFTILALGAALEWGRREAAYAGTSHGLYRTPNGGRAWKRIDLGDRTFQSLAISGDLALAGTEAQGLFATTDGGRRWQPIDLPAQTPTINALWVQPGPATQPVCLAGTDDGRILRSEDGGERWNWVAEGPAPILCLARAGQRLYAGLLNEGLLVSEDGGLTWTHDRVVAE